MEGLRELKVYIEQHTEGVIHHPFTSAEYSTARATMLDKIKGNKGWEGMRGRLESFDLNWSINGRTVTGDDASLLESVGELKKMLVGRRKAGNGQKI